MNTPGGPYLTTALEQADTQVGFSCGKRPLDDYFARHAYANDQAGIGRTYVLRRSPSSRSEFPQVLGFYTLSMASAESTSLSVVMKKRLPRYPMPVALIGRLAVDTRAQGRGLGEQLLMDALRRVVDAADLVGCTGVIVDAKDEAAEHFYSRYDFTTVTAERWPRRMFLPMGTIQAAFHG